MQLPRTTRLQAARLTCGSVRQPSVMRGAPVLGSLLMPIGKLNWGSLHQQSVDSNAVDHLLPVLCLLYELDGMPDWTAVCSVLVYLAMFT